MDKDQVVGSWEILQCANCGKVLPNPGDVPVGVCSIMLCDMDCLEEYERRNPELTPMDQYLEKHRNKNDLAHAVTKRK